MKYSRIPAPNIEMWHSVTDVFQSRAACPNQVARLNQCIDQQFMLVQTICSGIPRGSRYQATTSEKLMKDLHRELDGFLESTGLKFSSSCFGQTTGNQFDEQDFLGLWCLIMEIATMASNGSTIELSLGSFAEGLELEIGSDCQLLERVRILQSKALEFACQLMPVEKAIDLKCPLGGGAIQLNIVRHSQSGQRRTA